MAWVSRMSQHFEWGRERMHRSPHSQPGAVPIQEPCSMPDGRSQIYFCWFTLKDVTVAPSLHRPLSLQPRHLLLKGPSENMEPVTWLPFNKCETIKGYSRGRQWLALAKSLEPRWGVGQKILPEDWSHKRLPFTTYLGGVGPFPLHLIWAPSLPCPRVGQHHELHTLCVRTSNSHSIWYSQ